VRGESCQFLPHTDVSEVSRLGWLAGTGAREDPETRIKEETNESVPSAEARREAASALIESHDRVFRRTARRYSICADDAEDAYQRALEILLTKAPAIEGEALVRWMQTVTKREALGVRRQRERLLGSPRPAAAESDDGRDPLDLIASESPGPTDRFARRERVVRSGEALKALKPQEVRALTLKAEGYSYAEIGEITGWSYTKINRCMAEGRKRFLQVFAEIEAGERCPELADALSEMADGESANGSTEAVQFHLRSCATCRAKLRAYRAIPRKVFELTPIGPALDQSMGGRPHEWVAERAGAMIDKAREVGYSLISRGSGGGSGGDAASVAAAGGSRGAGMAAIAKVLAVCGATAAGGAACVAGGVVDPGAITGGSDGKKPALERPAEPVATTVPQQQEPKPVADPAPPPVDENAVAAPEPTPVQQKSRQFSIEAPPPAPSSPSTSSNEFGGASGGSSGGGGGSGGGGFGIEG
jgi:RNA polymerase sigma factor (sigma-70 family)